jgi:hypothetical protein
MKSLHYQIDRFDSGAKFQIVDRQKQQKNNWIVDQGSSYTQLGYDYAIVARFRDAETDKTVMVIAGIGGDGTRAAATFLTSPEYLRDLSSILSQNRNQKNFEVVLGSEIINGASGPPRVLATEIW